MKGIDSNIYEKNSKISVLCLLALSSLAGCNKGNTPEKPDEGDNPGNVDNKDDALKVDIDLPTVIPTLNEDSIQIHYQRKTGTYANWALCSDRSGHSILCV